MNDDRLKNAFAELRRAEMAHVPAFRVARQARLPVLHRLAFAWIVLLIVIGVAIIPRHRQPRPSITEWRAPTDFLLQTPGRELLNTIPDLKGTTQ